MNPVFGIDRGKHPALVAHKHPVIVRSLHEALLEKMKHPVRPDGLDLHLSDTKASVPRTTLGGLSRHEDYRAVCRSRMHLVIDHMLESLIVRGAQEHRTGHLLARPGIVHDLVPIPMRPQLIQLLRDVLDRSPIERRRISHVPAEGPRFAFDRFHELSDRHPRRDRMRVHDERRDDAAGGEGHVLLAIVHSDGALLPVPRADFVADRRNPILPESDLGKRVAISGHVGKVSIPVTVAIHEPTFVALESHAGVLVGDSVPLLLGHALADDDVSALDRSVLLDEPGLIDLFVVVRLHVSRDRRIWPAEEFLLSRRMVLVVLLSKGAIKGRDEQASIDRRLVDDHRVLLVESGEACDGHDDVDSVGKIVAVHDARSVSGHHRLLRVVEDMGHRVEAMAVVGSKDPDGLLSHRCECVLRVSKMNEYTFTEIASPD